jgi:putative flippase GtrA
MSFDPEYESIEAPGLRMLFFEVPWDSELLGYPVAQIDRLEIDDSGAAHAAFGRFRVWCDERRIRLASCRLSSERLRESMLLEEHGFRFIEMVYMPECLLDKVSPRAGTRLSIAEAGRSDLPAIESIAGSVFTMGRYLLDWRLDPDASHRRFRRWIRNSFDDPRHRVMKATVGDQIAGFFIVEERPGGDCYWHLAAMARQGVRGRNVGRHAGAPQGGGPLPDRDHDLRAQRAGAQSLRAARLPARRPPDDLPLAATRAAMSPARTLGQFVRYGIVGIASNGALYLLYLGLTAVGTGPKVAATIAYAAGVLQTFAFNRRWSFGHGGAPGGALLRYALAYGAGYFVNMLALVLFVDRAGYPHRWVQAVMILVLALFLFAVQKTWVFRERATSP